MSFTVTGSNCGRAVSPLYTGPEFEMWEASSSSSEEDGMFQVCPTDWKEDPAQWDAHLNNRRALARKAVQAAFNFNHYGPFYAGKFSLDGIRFLAQTDHSDTRGITLRGKVWVVVTQMLQDLDAAVNDGACAYPLLAQQMRVLPDTSVESYAWALSTRIIEAVADSLSKLCQKNAEDEPLEFSIQVKSSLMQIKRSIELELLPLRADIMRIVKEAFYGYYALRPKAPIFGACQE